METRKTAFQSWELIFLAFGMIHSFAHSFLIDCQVSQKAVRTLAFSVYCHIICLLWCVNLSQVCNLFCLWTHVGADVQIGCGQDSPLHAAVQSGGANIVDLLLDFGADGCCRNAEGKTPLDLSSPNSAVRIALQKRGMLWTPTFHLFMLHNYERGLSTRRYNNTPHYRPCLPRSLSSVAALPVLYSSKFGPQSPSQSLQPLPSSLCQGLPSLPISELCPASVTLCHIFANIWTKGQFSQLSVFHNTIL